MRWKPDGKTCIRKRRMNSLVSSVITLLYRSAPSRRYFARDGGLLSYGIDQVENWRRAATYLDRMLVHSDVEIEAAIIPLGCEPGGIGGGPTQCTGGLFAIRSPSGHE
jgi:hypothetical protein